jgi:SNF2 family DNA or RNA helicase
MTRSRADLRPAQIALIEELKSSLELGAVLGMGGGKTVSALTAFVDLSRQHAAETLIVLAPPRVVPVWKTEAAKWQHTAALHVGEMTGTGPLRLKAMTSRGWDVLVLSHDLIPWLVSVWPQVKHTLGRCVLCIDELSRFRNPRSKRAKVLLSILDDFDAVWGLTGTPQPDGYEDLYMPLKVLTGGRVWGRESFDDWRKMRFYPKDYGGFDWGIHSFAAEALDRTAEEFLLKVPDDHSSGIPDLNEGPDFDIWVDPTARQLEAHKEMLTRLIVEIENDAAATGRMLTDEDFVVSLSRGVASGKLEQIAQGFLYNDEREVAEILGTAKEDALADVLESAGEPCLITYRFKQDLNRIARVIGGPVTYLGGGVSQKQGQKNIDDWNAGKLKHFAIHPLSAGHGIELQFGGRRMVNYNPTWSGEEYAQLVKRIHRPGQTKPVYSHNVGVRGLIDELKISRCRGRVAEQIEFIKKLRSM